MLEIEAQCIMQSSTIANIVATVDFTVFRGKLWNQVSSQIDSSLIITLVQRALIINFCILIYGAFRVLIIQYVEVRSLKHSKSLSFLNIPISRL